MVSCAEFETLLADYIDRTLSASDHAAMEAHAAACSQCREFMADVTGAVRVLRRAEEITPPHELITRLAYAAPIGRVRSPFEEPGFFQRFVNRWLQPVLQPRLVMGMAMTILSFAMLERCTGVRVQHIQAADLNPIRILGGVEDKAIRAKDRAVKYYENLRWVYEIETQLRALQDTASTEAPNTPSKREGDTGNGARGSTKGPANPKPNQGTKK
jgi:hypothetical protein